MQISISPTSITSLPAFVRGVGVPAGPPPVTGPTFSRVVFIGASSTAGAFGNSLVSRNSAVEAMFAAHGATVEVYSRAVSGYTSAQILGLLQESMSAFATDTLFVLHAGGNDVNSGRPYPGNSAAFTSGITALIDQLATRPGCGLVSDLHFRDYDDSTYANEAAGSKPYNDNLLLPLLQSRLGDLVATGYYSDGQPATCHYEWSFAHQDALLSADNLHPSTDGYEMWRQRFAERIAPICLGTQPARQTRADWGGTTDAVVALGGPGDPALNLVTAANPIANGVSALTAIKIHNSDLSDVPGGSYQARFSPSANGAVSGYGINTLGAQSGAAEFDNSIYNVPCTSSSLFAGDGKVVTHRFDGLTPSGVYSLGFVGTRPDTSARITSIKSLSTGDEVTMDVATTPAPLPVSVLAVADASGRLEVEQTASGTWSHVSAIRIQSSIGDPHALVMQSGGVFVNFGVDAYQGLNTVTLGASDTAGVTGHGPFPLVNASGGGTPYEYTITYSAAATGTSVSYGRNSTGRYDGPASFDGTTLYCDPFTGWSLYAGDGYTVEHKITGLPANTQFQVSFIASRALAEARTSRFEFSTGEFALVDVTANPTDAAVSVTVTSTAQGELIFVQSIEVGTYSHLGGFRIERLAIE